jgi:hypothetical protein
MATSCPPPRSVSFSLRVSGSRRGREVRATSSWSPCPLLLPKRLAYSPPRSPSAQIRTGVHLRRPVLRVGEPAGHRPQEQPPGCRALLH